MKVLVVTNNIKPDSGWGRYSLGVLNEFSNQAIEYEVLTEKGGILPATSVVAFIKNCLKVRKRARTVDIVHAFDGWPYGVYAWIATVGTNKKFFINAIGTYSITPLKDIFKGFLLRRAYKKAKEIFAISDFIKRKVLENVRLNNICTVYLACSDLPHLNSEEVESYRHKYGIIGGQPVILTVGEIKDRKGQFEVVESIKILKNKHPDILYLMVGSEEKNPGYIKKIREYIEKESLEDNVKIITNAATDSDLSFFYTISDTFILNAKSDDRHFEGFGIVMLEAASFGKPVIGVSGTALEESMKDGLNGLLVKDGSPKGISQTIEKVLDEKEIYGSNSEIFYKNFSWKKTVLEYIKYYGK